MKETTQQQLFILSLHKNNNNEYFYIFNDAVSEEYKDMLFKSGFLVNDYYYLWGSEFEQHIKQMLKEGMSKEDIIENFENDNNIFEADIYTCNLLAWSYKAVNATEYLDEALQASTYSTYFDLLQCAQEMHKRAVWETVKGVLFKHYGVTE